jgi:NAD(P)-dependent dehydrogenase (short-subunit alcohol dehydrogenase family)
MGRAAALLFAREGAAVAALDCKAEGVQETVSILKRAGGKGLALAADVSREEEVCWAIAQAVRSFEKLDVLYNNAGIFPSNDHSVIDTEEKVWDRVLAVNVKGVYLICKHGIPELLRAGGGSVINTASFVAMVGCSVPQDAYTASKGAVIALTKSLAVQFGPKGVRSNTICPGPIETPLLTEWLLKKPTEKAKRLNRIPMGRFGRPEDIVSLALYLASEESSWTNGAVIVADGGITSNYF